jgi:hypothetical protein
MALSFLLAAAAPAASQAQDKAKLRDALGR